MKRSNSPAVEHLRVHRGTSLEIRTLIHDAILLYMSLRAMTKIESVQMVKICRKT